MENGSNSELNKVNISQKILRYPFNGRSSYLIDKFFIFGYNLETLKKYLYSNESLKSILNDIEKKSKLFSNEFELIKFHLPEFPTLINEFTSDYEKECLDIDMIKDMIFPKRINIYYTEEEKTNKYIEKKAKKRDSSNIENNKHEDKKDLSFSVFDESDNYNKKDINSLSYNVVFSSNPQSGNNSKKSINGFSHIFYKKMKDEKIYNNKIYSFYIPIIFCVISEYPFFNSFYQLCNQISFLFSSYDIRIPLEIVIHSIVNLTPSPLNASIELSLKSIRNMDIDTKTLSIGKEMNDIQEEDDNEENDTGENTEKTERSSINNQNNQNYQNSLNSHNSQNIPYNQNNIIDDNSDLMTKITYRPTGISSDKTLNGRFSNVNFGHEKKNSCMELNNRLKSGMALSGINNRTRRTVFVEKTDKGFNSQIISKGFGAVKHIKTASVNFLSSNILPNAEENEISKKIVFDVLTGYPLIQYNLAKVLLQTLSPIDVIDVFLYTFLEKDVLFFSQDLEFLSLTINSYLNLNFPLNDEKYYFINACVSYDNYINANSTFVGSTFTTIIGINNSYNQKYQTASMNKLKEHIAVDLDNGKVYKVEDKNDKEKSKRNRELFNFIKTVCKNRESLSETNILQREIVILNNELSLIYSKMREKISTEEELLFNINKTKSSYLSYDANIRSRNLKIQDSFYRFINNISLYFYQNLSLKIDSDDNKSKQLDNNGDQMNVMFLEEYKDDDSCTKEELYLIEELTETMKFQSFVYGFVQSYNPIDLYKIPLTFTEEFISIISRKSCILDKQISFLSLIDKLYEKYEKNNNRAQKDKNKTIEIDLEPILIDYYMNYKNYFDREIEDDSKKNILHPEKIKLCVYNYYKKIVKYKGYELDDRILMKYLYILNEIEDKEDNIFYKSLKRVKENIPKTISVTDIESLIEEYAIETGILTPSDLCCANIMILFTLSLSSLNSTSSDLQSFLGSLFQSFTFFRKYFSMSISMIFTIIEESLEKKDYLRARNYYYLYFLCINSLRTSKLIPNESLMNIIKKCNKLNSLFLNMKINENAVLKEKTNITKRGGIKLYGVDYPEDDITNKNLYITYNFSSYRTYNEKEIVQKINEPNIEDCSINIDSYGSLCPKIKFNNGRHPHQSLFYSQKLLLSSLIEDYKNYIIDMDDNKLRSKIILDACLNIMIFMRNTKEFINNGDILSTVKKIFYVFLNKLQIMKNLDKSH